MATATFRTTSTGNVWRRPLLLFPSSTTTTLFSRHHFCHRSHCTTGLVPVTPVFNSRLKTRDYHPRRVVITTATSTSSSSPSLLSNYRPISLYQRQHQQQFRKMSTIQKEEKGQEINAWSGPGPAAFDFRSDVVTTPTASMLAAISSTTLLDDVYAEDPTTNSLEHHLSTITKHPAALFVLSGTMGNQLAIRSHLTQPPYSILCDARSHIIEHEAGGVASLTGAMAKGILPANGKYLTLEDVKRNVTLSEDVHYAPTRVISLENTLGGVITPLAEIKRISAFARENGIKLHCDGARLWEAVAAGAGGLSEFTTQFDSVSLCFSKGLGAPVGSILVGSAPFIKQARWIRKSIGGGLRQAGVVTAAARVAVDETFGRGDFGEGGLLKRGHERAKRIANLWESLGGRLEKETETNMVWFDLESAGVEGEEWVRLGKQEGVRVGGGRLVVHYQICEEAVRRLERVMRIVLEGRKEDKEEEKVGV